MRVSLGIPFSSDDPSREAVFGRVLDELINLSDWCDWASVGVNRRGTFNRGATRNELVTVLDLSCEPEVIVLCDADSVPERDPLMRAVLGAAHDGMVHFPFTTVNQLAEDGTVAYAYGPSAGGCWVFRSETWWDLGGMDERGGWSLDDRSFLVQMKTFDKGPVFHPGVLTCHWHHRGPETRASAETRRILAEYHRLEGKPDELREYIQKSPRR